MSKGLRFLARAIAAPCVAAIVACSTAGSPTVESDGGDTVSAGPSTSDGWFWDDSEPVEAGAPVVQQSVDRGGDRTTLFVGDSVLAAISDDLAARVSGNLVFDAVNCRRLGQSVGGACGVNGRIDSGLDAIEDALEDRDDSQLPDVAVLVLANNSTVTADELEEAMDLLSGVPRVWWVNTRIDGFGRQDLNNSALEDLARRDDRARVIDWYSASEDRDLFADHVHPNDAGQRRLARLVRDHLACDCVP